jgi:hypothetical protein
MYRIRTLCLLLVVALFAAAAAQAEIVVSRDNAGRAITFDVRSAAADVEWYAGLLRSAAHGDEISAVTIRIVPPADVPEYCGSGASACYGNRRRPVIVVPAGRDTRTAQIMLHEYGHHLDFAWPVPGLPEPNGTPFWWGARGMAQLLRDGLVAFDYSLGWSRSIGEIFAEDYAQVHISGRYGIPWLAPPDQALRSGLLAELAGSGAAAPVAPQPPAVRPVLVERRGTLAARARRALPFQLLGPGRRVTFTAVVGRERRVGQRARIEIVCNGARVGRRALTRGRRSATLDLRRLGPARCDARLVSTTGARLDYTLRLRLAIEA